VSVAQRWSLLVAGEAALVLFLLTWGNSFTGSIGLHRAQLGILALLGAIGWVAILQRPGRLPMLLVAAPLALLASLAITSLGSAYPSLSWFATWQCAAYVGIAWLLAIQAQHPAGRRNLVAAMGIVVTLVVGVYLAVVAFAWAEWLTLGFPATSLPLRPLLDGGLIQLPTWVGDVVALCAPIVVVWMWIGNAKAPAVALALAAATAVVLSGTRSVLLLVVVLSIVAVAVVMRGRASRRVVLIGLLAGAVVVVVGLGVVLLAERGFDEGRSSAYGSALDQFNSSPIAGTGPGTYGVLRMGDAVDGLSHLAFPDANNVLLTTAGESGLVGLAGLTLAVAGYGLAMKRSWRGRSHDRSVAFAALFGIAIFAGHGLVDAIFVLIGVVLLMIASLSIAATGWPTHGSRSRRSRRLDAGLITGFVIILVSSTFLLRSEATLDAVARADLDIANSPQAAQDAARLATQVSPETVPAWWVRMRAADTNGDNLDSLVAAKRIVALEGFGQEWLSLAVIEARTGDLPAAADALGHATAHPPIDPLVELNAAILFSGANNAAKAIEAAERLLGVQPDIEPVVHGGPFGLAILVAQARAAAAWESLARGDADTAFVIALNGEDRDLATSLVERIPASDAGSAASWRAIIAAWFGDTAARTARDTEALASPSLDRLAWSWRLAIHACDPSAADRWERASEIAAGYRPVVPIAIGVSPDFHVRLLPVRYPGVVWRMDYPSRPYVAGTWTFALGRPLCATTPPG
jgi:O-antigen ligase